MVKEKRIVRVFSTSTCPWCDKVKDWLKENKIEFEDIDVSQNMEEARKMVEKSGQMGVPVIEIDNEIITGFDIVKLKKALKLE